MAQELAEYEDIARKVRYVGNVIKLTQDSITSVETCVKPVITAIHSACVGLGIDLITAADIRCFNIKNVDKFTKTVYVLLSVCIHAAMKFFK